MLSYIFLYAQAIPILLIGRAINTQIRRLSSKNTVFQISVGLAVTDILYATHELAYGLDIGWLSRLTFFGECLTLSGSLYLTWRLANSLKGIVTGLLKAAASADALETAIETNPNGFAFVSAEMEDFGRLITVNDQLCEMFRMPREELLSCTFIELTHPSHLDADLENVHALMRGDKPSYRMTKLYSRERLTEGSDIETVEFWWGDLSVGFLTESEAGGKRFLAQIVDIDEHVRAATLDPLCAVGGQLVYNRRHIIHQINVSVAAWGRGQICSLIVFDVDNFKSINEEFNHLGGDHFLQHVAWRTLDVIRTSDVLARPGGDEFWVLLPEQNVREAFGVAQRIRESINKPYHNVIPGQTIRDVSVSVGVADVSGLVIPDGHEIPREGLSHSAGEFVKAADSAVFEAKRAGKNQVVAASDDVANYWETLRDISKGLADDQFVLWYQPIINNKTMLVDGFEALVRWNHPKRGMIFPDQFISVLEDSRSIHELDRAVIRMAAERQTEITGAGGTELIRVNVSPLSLDRPTFLDDLGEPILENGTGVEVTELIKLTESAEHVLEIIRENGNKVSLDDLGSGDRSLRQILKVDCIKLDRINLVQDIEGETGDICRAIISLAHCLNPKVTVVAEGVETEEQLGILNEMGCDFSQGYFFAKPMPWDQAREWARAHNARELGGSVPAH